MWKKLISLLLVLIFTGCSATDAADTYTNRAAIETGGEGRYKAVRLTPPVYNSANGDLSDLLIKDGAGENVPYFINTGYQRLVSNKVYTQMELINSYIKDDNFYFDYKLADEQDSDIISTSIQYVTYNDNFGKVVDLYGSYDNLHWDYVQNDKLYSIDGNSKLEIEFLQPQKFTHYRLKLANNLEQISFENVSLIYSVATSEEINYVEGFEPVFTVASADKKTEIKIEGMRNLRLCDVTIHTDSMFKRSVSAPQGYNTELYNLTLNGESYADTTLPLNWQVSQDDIFTLYINDGDDKPITVDRISVRYFADELVFDGGAGGGHTLVFGRDETKTAPVYDIGRYRDDILQGPVDRASIGAIHYATAEKAPERDYRMIFNILVVAVALLLGALILLKLRKK